MLGRGGGGRVPPRGLLLSSRLRRSSHPNCDIRLAQIAKSSQSFLERYPTNVHGEYDYMYDKMAGFFSDWGEGSKDANYTIDQMFLNIISRKRTGNRVLVLVNDCGGHQHNQHVVGFGKLLVDHGFFDVVLLVREPS